MEQMYKYMRQTGTDSQKFRLDKIEEPKQIEVEEGIYYIHTKLNENNVLDVAEQSTLDSANVQTWEKSAQKTKNQMFKIEKTEDGYYKITAQHSGKVLDVFGAKTENCTNVQQYEYNGSNAQKWQIIDVGNGYVSFISVCNGLYLDVAGASTANGANVQVYESNGTDSQKFKLTEVKEVTGTKTIEDGTYMIKTWSNNNIGLDVESFSRENGANVQLWTSSAVISKNQRFIVTYQGDGTYQILAQHSEKSLNVAGNGLTNGTNVEQYESNGSDAQKWVIKDNGDGSYSIISKLNGLYIDVTNGNIQDGTNIQMYESNGTDSQKFAFEKVEKPTCQKTIEDGVYKISTALDTNMYLDIAEGAYENEATLQLWSQNILQQQKFELTYNEEGYYEIKSVNSGKLLDVRGGSNNNGTLVQQFESNGTEYQKWILQPVGNGYYYIVSKGAEAYLDVPNDNISNGTKLQIYDGNQSTSQMFKFEEVPIINTSSIYNIVTNIDSSKVLDVDLNSSNLQIWTLNEQSNNQKFKLEYLEDGYYKIVCRETEQVLTVDGTNVIQSEDNNLDSQKWKIKTAENGSYYIISKNTGLYLDVNGAINIDGRNVGVFESNGSEAQKFKFSEAKEKVSNFESLDDSKYPGYKEKLQKLQNEHPNWIITIDYIGLDWNTVIDNEDQLVQGSDGSVSARSLTQYTDEWRTEDLTEYEPGWYRASRAAIEYIMDPRNSLDDEYVFQFQDLTSSAGTYSDIAKMIEGTYLTEYEEKGITTTDSIINTILSSATTYNISPFHLVSRMIQEQGTGGTPLSDGYVYNDGIHGQSTVYNLFNIQATGSTKEEIWQNGAAYAYNHHWFSPELCINGSTAFLYNDYLSQGQTTLYYQKYDVVQEPYYTHQYMTNIRGANDEGQRVAKEYKANGMIDSQFEFTIPVYENMPQEPCPRPNGTTPW